MYFLRRALKADVYQRDRPESEKAEARAEGFRTVKMRLKKVFSKDIEDMNGRSKVRSLKSGQQYLTLVVGLPIPPLGLGWLPTRLLRPKY